MLPVVGLFNSTGLSAVYISISFWRTPAPKVTYMCGCSGSGDEPESNGGYTKSVGRWGVDDPVRNELVSPGEYNEVCGKNISEGRPEKGALEEKVGNEVRLLEAGCRTRLVS